MTVLKGEVQPSPDYQNTTAVLGPQHARDSAMMGEFFDRTFHDDAAYVRRIDALRAENAAASAAVAYTLTNERKGTTIPVKISGCYGCEGACTLARKPTQEVAPRVTR